MKVTTIENIIKTINDSEYEINHIKLDLVTKVMMQGYRLMMLQEQLQVNKSNLNDYVDISKTTVLKYIDIASSNNFQELFPIEEFQSKAYIDFKDKDQRLEPFSLVNLQKLSKVPKNKFNAILEDGAMPKDELTLEEQITDQENKVNNGIMKLEALRLELHEQEGKETLRKSPEVLEDKANIIEAKIIESPEKFDQVKIVSLAIVKAGGATALSKILGVHRSNPHSWKTEHRQMSEEIKEKLLEYLSS